ncbi:MAG: glycoside hydrolase domain-containing protein [Paludibacter sp.]
MIAKNNSVKNKYIQRVKLNGKIYSKRFITHSDIVSGGELVFEMGELPQTPKQN